MKNYLIVLTLIATANISNAQSIAANQEKYTIVASAKAYSTYPYFSISNFSLTDLGSSVAFVTHAVPTQDKSFIKFNSSGTIPLTSNSGLYGDNYTGTFLQIGGLSMSQNEQFYYYLYQESAFSTGIILQLSINYGILPGNAVYVAGENQRIVGGLATNNSGTLVAIVQNYDAITKVAISYDLLRMSSSGHAVLLERILAANFSIGKVYINEQGAVFTQSWTFPFSLYKYSNLGGLKSEIAQGVAYNSNDNDVQTTSADTVYYLSNNRIIDSQGEVLLDRNVLNSNEGKNLQIVNFFVSPHRDIYTISSSQSSTYLMKNNELILSTEQTLLGKDLSFLQSLRGNKNGEITFVAHEFAPLGNSVQHLIKYSGEAESEYNLRISSLNLLGANLCDEMSQNDPTICRTIEIKDQSNVFVSFGAHLNFELLDRNNNIIPATFSLVEGTFILPPKPDLEQNSLYQDKIALFFKSVQQNSQSFITVHMGIQELKIVPKDRNPLILKLNSIEASAIGIDNNKYDHFINLKAHQIGVPPQYIKGHISKEAAKTDDGNFIENSYRYEPVFDLKNIQTKEVENISGDKSKYLDYSFYQNPDKPTPVQIEPRNIYKIFFNSTLLEHIPNDYETTVGLNRTPAEVRVPIEAFDILVANDLKHNWLKNAEEFCVELNVDGDCVNLKPYSKMSSSEYADAVDFSFHFVAQTVTAASYGLYQIMYTTAVTAADYTTTVKRKNIKGIEKVVIIGKDPTELLKPEISINNGGHYLKKAIIRINTVQNRDITKVETINDLNTIIKFGYAGYNLGLGPGAKSGSKQMKKMKRSDYGLDYREGAFKKANSYSIKID